VPAEAVHEANDVDEKQLHVLIFRRNIMEDQARNDLQTLVEQTGGAHAEANQNMSMKKVAVFGNAGGGKSTLSRQLAKITGLPLYVLDIIRFRGGVYRLDEKEGGKLPDEEYVSIHREILSQDEWIIDGYGNLPTVWERISAADTLVHIDLPIMAHYWGVTRRFAMGLFQNPEGWPENSPIWESTLDGYRVILPCHRILTPKYRQCLAEAASSKQVHHLTSRTAMKAYLQAAAKGGGIQTETTI
jgi:adenylate kinase family enzyme